MIEKLFRKELKNVQPYVQGKPAEEVRREYGLDRIEKLASNENQFGPSPMAVKAMEKELRSCNFYPESVPVELAEKLSKRLGVDAANIAIGSSGESLIRLINLTFIEEGDEIIVADPTFSPYESQAALMGGKTVSIPLKDDGSFDIDGMLGAVNDKTKLIWLCTPNNPTGNIVDKSNIEKIVRELPEHVVLVLDEAYYEYASAFSDYPKDNTGLLAQNDSIIILRTFSKVYGIAGLRIGYVISSEPIVNMINSLKLTFEINRLAQVAANAALDDEEYLHMITSENKDALEYLMKYFDEKGWNYIKSYANFIWVDTGADSKQLFEDLQKKGIIIRPGFLWGWKNWIRISTGTREQMEFFKGKMEEILG